MKGFLNMKRKTFIQLLGLGAITPLAINYNATSGGYLNDNTKIVQGKHCNHVMRFFNVKKYHKGIRTFTSSGYVDEPFYADEYEFKYTERYPKIHCPNTKDLDRLFNKEEFTLFRTSTDYKSMCTREYKDDYINNILVKDLENNNVWDTSMTCIVMEWDDSSWGFGIMPGTNKIHLV